MKEGGSTEDKFIRNLHKGDFFGEKALSGEEVASIKEILSGCCQMSDPLNYSHSNFFNSKLSE